MLLNWEKNRGFQELVSKRTDRTSVQKVVKLVERCICYYISRKIAISQKWTSFDHTFLTQPKILWKKSPVKTRIAQSVKS